MFFDPPGSVQTHITSECVCVYKEQHHWMDGVLENLFVVAVAGQLAVISQARSVLCTTTWRARESLFQFLRNVAFSLVPF